MNILVCLKKNYLAVSKMVWMILNLFIIYLTNAGVDAEIDFSAVTHRVGTVLCPYTNFCLFNASDELVNDTEQDTCCSTCSCDDSCYESRSCCPDKSGVAERCKLLWYTSR